MGDAQNIIAVKALSGVSLEQARVARASAWAFVFDCYEKKKATRPGGPDDTKESKNDGAARTNCNK
jgi:hypothetical protein